jgi:hypothetical protein
VAALLVVLFFWSAPRGLDLSDEGYHLITLRHSGVAPQGVSQFGTVVRILTLGTTLNVAGYRILGLVVLELSAVAFAFAALRFFRARLRPVAAGFPPTGAVVSAAMIGGMLGYSWLPRTISYLVLTPALLCVIGALCLALSIRGQRSFELGASEVAAAIAWGLAGGVLFYTKFSSAVAAMALAGLAVWAAAGWRRALIAGTLAFAAFAVLVLAFDVGGAFSISRLSQTTSTLGAGSHSVSAISSAYRHELGRLLSPIARDTVKFLPLLLAPVLLVRFRRPAGLIAASVCALLGAVAFGRAVRSSRALFESSPTVVFAALLALAIGAAIGATVRRSHASPDEPGDGAANEHADARAGQRAWVTLAIVLVGFPFAGSLGTNTGLLSVALSSGAILAVAAVTLFAVWRVSLPTGVRGSAFVALPLVFALGAFAYVISRGLTSHLYKVPASVSSESQAITGSAPLSGVRVDPATKRLVTRTLEAASRGGRLPRGSTILTSTGLEGLAYALDGYIPGSGWIDSSPGTCSALARARSKLATTQLVVQAAPLGPKLDACFRRTVPGYPDAFAVVDTIPLGPRLAREVGVDAVEVLRRR